MGFVEHVGPMMKLAVSTSYREDRLLLHPGMFRLNQDLLTTVAYMNEFSVI